MFEVVFNGFQGGPWELIERKDGLDLGPLVLPYF